MTFKGHIFNLGRTDKNLSTGVHKPKFKTYKKQPTMCENQ